MKNMNLPYNGLITKILEHIGFDLENKESNNKHQRISQINLSLMRVKITDGVPVQLSPKVKKKSSFRISSASREHNYGGFKL